MRTLIYTTVKDQFLGHDLAITLRTSKNTASVRVIEFWKGEIEQCDTVITDNEAVSSAYKKAGIQTKPFTKPKTISYSEPVEKVFEKLDEVEESKPRGRPSKGVK